MERPKINEFIRKNRGLSRKELATRCGISVSAVAHREHALGLGREWVYPTKEKQDHLSSEALYTFLKKTRRVVSVEDLSNHFDCPVREIRKTIDLLLKEGKNIVVDGGSVELAQGIPQAKPTVIDVSKFKAKHFKFGLTSDNHLGSKYERLDVLNALFDIWKGQGVGTVYQCGNMIDGEARFNKFDVFVHGIQAQVDYFVDKWPAREGIVTHFITGDDHEGWYVQREGINIGKLIEMTAQERGRKDLRFLGHMEHDITLQAKDGCATMRLIHAGGGSAYATSYAPQKIVESYQGGEKPNILLVGHYHKAEYGYPREVHVIQAGCTEDQTPFMRKLKIQAHVGGWTIEFDQDDLGIIHHFRVEWHPFYDKGYYDKAWKYWWNK